VDDLAEPLGLQEVLEAVLAEVAQGRAVGEVALDQRPCGRAEQDLPAVAGSGDPRGAVDVNPDVALAAERPQAGVQAYPHPDVDVVGPTAGGERRLRVDRGGQGLQRIWEDDEEGVTLGADDAPSVAGEGLTEGDRSRRQVPSMRHPASLQRSL
jgi:hypothetical protein